jgi:hypothetical protein
LEDNLGEFVEITDIGEPGSEPETSSDKDDKLILIERKSTTKSVPETSTGSTSQRTQF